MVIAQSRWMAAAAFSPPCGRQARRPAVQTGAKGLETRREQELDAKRRAGLGGQRSGRNSRGDALAISPQDLMTAAVGRIFSEATQTRGVASTAFQAVKGSRPRAIRQGEKRRLRLPPCTGMVPVQGNLKSGESRLKGVGIEGEHGNRCQYSDRHFAQCRW